MKSIEISPKLEEAIKSKGVKDPHVMEALVASVEFQLEEDGIDSSLRLVWPSPKEWIGALIGASLSGALTPEELAVGTVAGAAGAKIVDLAWPKMRNFFVIENVPIDVKWKEQSQPSGREFDELGEIIQTVTTSANQIWRPNLTEQEKRMEAAIYRRAMRDLTRRGPLSHIAMHLI